MRYFGTTSGSNDIADKAYVDSVIGDDGEYNSVSTVSNLPVNKKKYYSHIT